MEVASGEDSNKEPVNCGGAVVGLRFVNELFPIRWVMFGPRSKFSSACGVADLEQFYCFQGGLDFGRECGDAADVKGALAQKKGRTDVRCDP